MFPPDELAARLPPPRDDEPRQLRQDIIDELGDHLACALRRELLKERVGEGEAQNRVLSRFGDPAALVRRLWRDAIWEQVMSQRMLIGLCAVTVVLCVCVMGVSWAWVNQQSAMLRSWKESQEAQRTEQNALFQRLVDQSTASTTALAARVDKLSESAASVPSEWNPVEYEFRADGKEGPPVAGVQVYMRIAASETGIPPMEGYSNEQGIVRFERVRYGSYTIRLTTPTGALYSKRLVLQLGESRKDVIACPVNPPVQRTEVHVRVHWPKELEDKSLSIHINPQSIRRPVDGLEWAFGNISDDRFGSQPESLHRAILIFDAAGKPFRAEQGLRDDSRAGRRPSREHENRPTIEVGRLLSADADVESNYVEPFLVWPGSGFEIGSAAVLETLSDHANEGRRFATQTHRFGVIRLSAKDWKSEVEAGEPATLWLTPTPAAIEQIVQDLKTIEQLKATIPESNLRSFRGGDRSNSPAETKSEPSDSPAGTASPDRS